MGAATRKYKIPRAQYLFARGRAGIDPGAPARGVLNRLRAARALGSGVFVCWRLMFSRFTGIPGGMFFWLAVWRFFSWGCVVVCACVLHVCCAGVFVHVRIACWLACPCLRDLLPPGKLPLGFPGGRGRGLCGGFVCPFSGDLWPGMSQMLSA